MTYKIDENMQYVMDFESVIDLKETDNAEKTGGAREAPAMTAEEMLAAKPDGMLDYICEHKEYGNYYIRQAAPASGSFEHLYFDKLRDLILRKWSRLFPCCPIPEIKRAELLSPQDLEPGCPFAPVQGILVKIQPSPSNKIFMRPGRLEASLAKNACMCFNITKDQVAVSPFFEWELADFWEGGSYELD